MRCGASVNEAASPPGVRKASHTGCSRHEAHSTAQQHLSVLVYTGIYTRLCKVYTGTDYVSTGKCII